MKVILSLIGSLAFLVCLSYSSYPDWGPPPADDDDGINIKTRHAVESDRNLWPNGIIYILNALPKDSNKYGYMDEAMKHIEQKTNGCLRFKHLTREGQVKDYVYLYDGKLPGQSHNGSYSHVGRIGGRQGMSMEYPQVKHINQGIHELLHAAGLYHTHSRPDRNNWIIMHKENGDPSVLDRAFNIVNGRYNPNSFDFDSIMLYSSDSYSINGKPVFTKKNGSWVPDFFKKPGMSQGDVDEIKRLYKCKK